MSYPVSLPVIHTAGHIAIPGDELSGRTSTRPSQSPVFQHQRREGRKGNKERKGAVGRERERAREGSSNISWSFPVKFGAGIETHISLRRTPQPWAQEMAPLGISIKKKKKSQVKTHMRCRKSLSQCSAGLCPRVCCFPSPELSRQQNNFFGIPPKKPWTWWQS